MTTALVIVIFLLVIVSAFATFVCLELYAQADDEDDFHTLSTYIKRVRRRAGIAGSIVLTLAIFGPAFWLWGHLVMEWW